MRSQAPTPASQLSISKGQELSLPKAVVQPSILAPAVLPISPTAVVWYALHGNQFTRIVMSSSL